MIELREYQLEMIANIRAALRRVRRVLAQAPTGSGKTALASFMAGQTAAGDGVAWFICHRSELVEQTGYTFRKFDIAHGYIAAGWETDLRQRVQVCSIDTLKNRVTTLAPPRLLIWDECHHLGAAGWAAVQGLFPRAYHIGLSATPTRLDGRGLDAHFDEMVCGPTVAWLIEHGYLSPYRVYAPSAPDMSGVNVERGDYVRGQAADAMDRPKLTGDAITHWRKYANGLRSVGFAVTVAHSQHLAQQFRDAGIAAAHLDGSTPKGERAQVIRDFAEGSLRVLFNVDLFGEGFDLSAIAQRDVTIDCVLQLRPTQSLALHRQQVGRALRPADGKVAVILDHAGNSMRHGLPDDEVQWSLMGRAKGKRKADDDEEGPPPPRTCPGCFGQVRQPTPPLCPYCGHPLARHDKPPEVAPGELVLVSPEVIAQQKADERRHRRREEDAADSLAAFVAIAQRRGYPQPQRWAFVQWSRRRKLA